MKKIVLAESTWSHVIRCMLNMLNMLQYVKFYYIRKSIKRPEINWLTHCLVNLIVCIL